MATEGSPLPPPDGAQVVPVLAIGVDQLTQGRITSSLRGTEFAFESALPEDACERLRSLGVPSILLVEWGGSHAEHASFCETLRASVPSARVSVIAIGGPADHASLLQASEEAADDALARPFDQGALLFRLRRAARALKRSAGATDARVAVDEALRHGTGEVVVRSGDVVGRIHVQGGHIAWAAVSSAPATLEEIVKRAGVTADDDLIDAIKQECRAAGAHFMDVLVRWGLIDRARARETLRVFVVEQVKRILELPGAVALFLPRSGPRLQSDSLAFDASEVAAQRPAASPSAFPAPGPESRRFPAAAGSSLVDLVERAMRAEGALGAAVLEQRGHTCLHQAGVMPDATIIWSQVAALSALGPTAEEMLAADGERYLVTRALKSAPDLVLLVSFEGRAISLGLARVAVAAAANQAISLGSESRADKATGGFQENG